LNERQYQQVLSNNGAVGRRAQPIGGAAAEVVRHAARKNRKWRAAAVAWGELAGPGLAERTAVEAFSDGELVIGVADPAHLYQLTQRAARYAKELGRALPGLRSVRFRLLTPGASSGPEMHPGA
jgi:hypothetical protein